MFGKEEIAEYVKVSHLITMVNSSISKSKEIKKFAGYLKTTKILRPNLKTRTCTLKKQKKA